MNLIMRKKKHQINFILSVLLLHNRLRSNEALLTENMCPIESSQTFGEGGPYLPAYPFLLDEYAFQCSVMHNDYLANKLFNTTRLVRRWRDHSHPIEHVGDQEVQIPKRIYSTKSNYALLIVVVGGLALGVLIVSALQQQQQQLQSLPIQQDNVPSPAPYYKFYSYGAVSSALGLIVFLIHLCIQKLGG